MRLTIVQQKIFEDLKTIVPEHLSLAALIADTLKISRDAAYRRIRGETRLSSQELELLSKRFDITIDVAAFSEDDVMRRRKVAVNVKR